MENKGPPLALAFLCVSLSHAHPSYLSDCPNLKDQYFSQWGSGAVGHDGGRSGASLNSFGETFRRGALKLDKCAVTDDDDDDDDDDDHHSSWGTKMCCADSDHDGLTNGEELGDPCCEWKKKRAEPWANYNVSHPALQNERTTERRVCNGTHVHRRPPCQPWPPGPTPPPAPSPAPSGNECNPAKTCSVCTACCKPYIQDGAECDSCVKAECPTPPPTPPPPTPLTCEGCLTDKMVWCYNDMKCWAHDDPGNTKNGTCPGYEHCASDKGCTCNTCSDTRCQPPKECNPAVGCNVCDACCKSYIADGIECNACAKLQCRNAPAGRTNLYVQGHNARTILHATNLWHQTASLNESTLIWVRNRCVLGTFTGRPGQAVNRLDVDNVVANKAMLAQLVGHKDFVPQTLVLAKRQHLAAVRRAFSGPSSGPKAVWILKPADMSKGIGVRVLPDPAAWAAGSGAQEVVDSGKAHVLQKYIANPLLLDGFKCEVRVYFLVASVAPLRVLWFPKGSVRLAAQRFEHAQWDNPLVHIVNTAQGKQVLGEEEYARRVAAAPRKWTFTEMAAHLAGNSSRGTAADPWELILAQMKHAVATVLRAAAPSMQSANSTKEAWHPFALMGADFLLDENHKAWLTEVQEGPGLSHVAERVKEDFVPTMVSEAALIGVKAATLLALDGGSSMQGLEAGTRFELLL